MAPEYAMNEHFSVKSDVYSFGVLLLEIVSRHKNSALCHGGDVNLLNCVSNYVWLLLQLNTRIYEVRKSMTDFFLVKYD